MLVFLPWAKRPFWLCLPEVVFTHCISTHRRDGNESPIHLWRACSQAATAAFRSDCLATVRRTPSSARDLSEDA